MSEASYTLEFAEPEPLPPTPLRSQSPANGSRKKSSSSDSDSPSWLNLSIPGAILNGTILIIGKSLELVEPYWPNEERRERAYAWAQQHPILTSFLLAQLVFVVMPVVWFLTFAFWVALVVGVGAVVVAGGVLGLGLCFFIPIICFAVFMGTITWAWGFACYKLALVAWNKYVEFRAGSNHPSKSTEELKNEEEKRIKQEKRRQAKMQENGGEEVKAEKKEEEDHDDGDRKVTETTNVLSADETEESRPLSPNSIASSGVDVDVDRGDYGEDGHTPKDGVKVGGNRDEDRVHSDIMRSLS